MVEADLTVGIRRRNAAAVGRTIKADDGRWDFTAAESGLDDWIRFETKPETPRYDVAVFVLPQLARSGRIGVMSRRAGETSNCTTGARPR
jgi:hypothetical protein